jgi:hypothetical protein
MSSLMILAKVKVERIDLRSNCSKKISVLAVQASQKLGVEDSASNTFRNSKKKAWDH